MRIKKKTYDCCSSDKSALDAFFIISTNNLISRGSADHGYGLGETIEISITRWWFHRRAYDTIISLSGRSSLLLLFLLLRISNSSAIARWTRRVTCVSHYPRWGRIIEVEGQTPACRRLFLVRCRGMRSPTVARRWIPSMGCRCLHELQLIASARSSGSARWARY